MIILLKCILRIGGDKHDELINLIKEYRKEIKQMISNIERGDKHE